MELQTRICIVNLSPTLGEGFYGVARCRWASVTRSHVRQPCRSNNSSCKYPNYIRALTSIELSDDRLLVRYCPPKSESCFAPSSTLGIFVAESKKEGVPSFMDSTESKQKVGRTRVWLAFGGKAKALNAASKSPQSDFNRLSTGSNAERNVVAVFPFFSSDTANMEQHSR